MLVSATNLASGRDATTGTSVTTSSVSPATNKLILVAVATDNGGTAAPTFTLSGCGLTWTQVTSIADAGGTRRLTVFRGLGSATSGSLTITKSASTNNCSYSIDQFSNVVYSSNGDSSLQQSATNRGSAITSLTVTLAAFSSVNNATYGAFFMNATGTLTDGSGFTRLGFNNSTTTIQTQYKNSNDTSVDWSWSGSAVGLGIGLEIIQGDPAGGAFLYNLL